MNKNKVSLVVWIVILLLLFVVSYVFINSKAEPKGVGMMEDDYGSTTKNDNSKTENESMTSDLAMVDTGSYEMYSPEKIFKAENNKVVLFFRASWCPTCRALDKDIRVNLKSIPSGVIILDVDYDNSSLLKQKYGVTYQHTLVQVDKDGNLIKKWTGSPTLTLFIKEII